MEESERLEKFLFENGYKKTVIIQKAIMEYLDNHAEDSA